MSSAQIDEKAIFNVARQLGSADARQKYLQQVCKDDDLLLERVRVLLDAYFEETSFLESPAFAEAVTNDTYSATQEPPLGEQRGDQLGPYKLLQQIGEGGMGTVWMAEQHEPVRRRVALKLVKPGLDSRQVIARFGAERQALSMMDHPNIAKVLDAGTTESGRPYFVMELVKGQPITEYCDDKNLSPRERLELFLPVCQAIQHAHHKGIIHRDIKPSNVLVAEYDGRPVAKVIDFGVAKALHQPLTENTMFTGLGQIIGTLEYMSPEQARVNQLDVDTRSDIYSLGVLLYELLTGGTPFDRKRLRALALDELLRVIREEEPPRPSTKLSSSATLPSIAAHRRTEPVKLSTLMRGELDWIVMRALEKDRNRRYETANGFAMDIQRYLAGEVVQACPPSSGYRFKKFATRNKAALAAGSLVAAALVIGLLGTSWQSIRAMHAERLALTERDRTEEARRETDLQAEKARQSATAERVAKEEEFRQRQLAEQALQSTEAALTEAERERQRADEALNLANTERERAEENLNLALGALDKVYVNAIGTEKLLSSQRDTVGNQETWTGTPAGRETFLVNRIFWTRINASERNKRELPLSDAEKTLLKLGLQFYEQLASMNLTSPVALRQAGQAAFRVGVIKLAVREFDEAVDAFGVAANHYSTATQQFTDDVDIQLEKAEVFRGLAQCYAQPSDREDSLRAALNCYSAGIAIDPSDPYLYCRRGTAYWGLNEFNLAQQDLEKAIELKPDEIHFRTILSQFLMHCQDHRYRDYPRASIHLISALELEPNSIAIRLRLAWLYEQYLKDLDKAQELVEWILEREPSNPNALDTSGIIAVHRNQLDEALADFNRALEIEPLNSFMLNSRAKLYARMGLVDKAEADFKVSEKAAHGENYWLYEHWGKLYLNQGRYDEALEKFNQGIQLGPNHPWFYMFRGKTYFLLERYTEALTDFQRALSLEPTMFSLYISAAQIAACPDEQFKQGVIELANQAVDRHPEVAQLWLARGLLYLESGQHEQALEIFSKAIELHPSDPSLWSHRGLARMRLQQTDSARQDYSRAIELDEKYADWHHWRGDALRKLGLHEEAIADYSQSIALNPHGAWSWSHRGTSRVALGLFEEALEDYRRAIKLAPQENHFRWRLGEAYQKMGERSLSEKQFQQAIDYLTQSFEIDPAAHHRYKRRAVAYFENAQFNEALADLRRARELNPEDLSTLTWIPPNRVADCPSEEFRIDLMKLADEAVELNPAARSHRAIIALNVGQVSQARQDMSAVIENEKAGYYEYYQAAMLALADSRDLEQYRSACQKMLTKFSSSDDPTTMAFTGWICAVVPDALDDLSPALQMAQRALESAPDNTELRRSLGALQYRAGNHSGAIETLTPLAADKAPDGQALSSSAYPLLFLAMAQFGAGEIESAQQTLERAQTLAKSELENPSNVIWNRKLTLELLLEEARSLMGFDFPIDRVHDQQ